MQIKMVGVALERQPTLDVKVLNRNNYDVEGDRQGSVNLVLKMPKKEKLERKMRVFAQFYKLSAFKSCT